MKEHNINAKAPGKKRRAKTDHYDENNNSPSKRRRINDNINSPSKRRRTQPLVASRPRIIGWQPPPAPKRKTKHVTLVPDKSYFFSLPPELRVMIYRLCLLEQESIHINADFQQHPLLQVSSLIRQEARPIWYKKNKFTFTVRDCDSSLLRKFMPYRIALNMPLKFYFELRGSPHWPNLMAWCLAAHRDECDSLSRENVRTPLAIVIAHAMDIVVQHQGDWEKCNRALWVLYKTACLISPRWRCVL